MKTVVRKRTEIAACMNIVAREAHQKAQVILLASIKTHRKMNPNERVMYNELEAISDHYKEEASRHMFAAMICGNSVLDIRPI